MMKTLIRIVRLELTAFALLFLAPFAGAQSVWNTASGNWSSTGSWSPAAVPAATTNVVFTNNVGAPTTAGTVDNTVDTSFAGPIGSLQYSQNTNSGGINFYHTTQIASGQTLTVTGGLTVGTLTDGVGNGAGTNVVVNTQIAGSGAALAVTGGNVVVNQASAQSGAHLAILNMTNLDTFTANIGRLQVGVANGVNRAEGNLFLAKTNVINLSGSAPQLYMGFNNGNNNSSQNFPILELGLSNAFFVDSITVSADKQGNPASRLLFNPVFTNANPYAYFRGTNGANSRVSNWILGNNSAQANTGSSSDGTNDFSSGTLDAMVNNMTIGISEFSHDPTKPTSASGNGTFTFTAGTNNINTLILGDRVATNGNSVGNATMNVNGTATLIVNTAVCMSFFTPGGNNVYGSANLNINGGTVLAATITNGVPGGGNLANITMTGGLLGITSLLGSVGTTASPLETISFDNSTLQMPISGLQTNVVATTIGASGSTNIINITSIPAGVITYPTQFPLIAYGSGGLSGTFNFGVSNLPGIYEGFISNNTQNSTIDLVLTKGPTTISTLEWTGSAGANWNTTTLDWLSGGSPVAYFDGASVLFDDNATGPTAVNLASNFSPASVTVNNSSLSYSFSGAGIIGSGGLIKSGTGTLLFTNSGNTFVGNVTINAGTIQFGNGGVSGVLPATGSVTDNGNLILDHSNNQNLANAISGSGILTQSGSNVVTITGSNSFTGTTVVNAGTLVLNGVLSGSLTNVPGSTVGGSGTNVGPVMVSGAIQPSASTGVPSTFTSGDLDLSAGATLTFALNGADATTGNGVNDLLQGGGNFNPNNNVVSLNFAGVPQTGVPYTLINFAGTQTGNLSSTVAGTHFTAAISQGTSPVTVTLSGSGANLKWVSTTNAIWDVGVTTNWLNGASLSVFYSGDNVLFDDTVGVVTNVTIGAGLVAYPNVVTVNSSVNDFTIAGRISGQASIEKLGASILTLSSGANDFSNGTEVAAGTLRLGANGAAGHGATYVTNSATLDLNASTMAGNAVVSGTGVNGNGVIVNNGFILNGDQHAFDSGTILYLAGHSSFGVSNRWDIRNGSLSSSDGNPWNLTLLGPADFHLVNATVDSSLGNVDVVRGQFVIETTTIQDSPGWAGDSTHGITVESGAQFGLNPSSGATLSRAIALNSGTLQNGGGNNDFNGSFTLQGNATIDVAGGTVEIDSAIAGSGSLTKTSAGSLKLTGDNTYTNSTFVDAGALSFTDTGSISNSAYVDIAAGALIDVSPRTDTTLTLGLGQTLQGNGMVAGNLLVSTGSTFSPGTNSSFIGTFIVTNATTLSGTTVMKINATTGASDQLISSNTMACGGTIVVTNLSGTITNGQTFQLFVSASFNGTFATAMLPSAPGLTWTNNLASNGTLIAGVASTSVPQPYITSVSLSGTNLILNGTNGLAGEQYDILTSTNVASPLSSWTSISSSTFSSGNFSITNPVTPNTPREFYIIRIP